MAMYRQPAAHASIRHTDGIRVKPTLPKFELTTLRWKRQHALRGQSGAGMANWVPWTSSTPDGGKARPNFWMWAAAPTNSARYRGAFKYILSDTN